MSIEHKAFVFDYEAFTAELSNILQNALLTNNTTKLASFIKQNLASLKDPYEGEPLDNTWQNMVKVNDPHQCGDFALTKFYDPQTDIGLGYNWQKIQNILKQEGGTDSLVLGVPLGQSKHSFDPGKMGSYFQSPTLVHKNLILLKDLLEKKPELFSVLDDSLKMIQKAVAAGKGLYVTF